ncbi:sortase domain-bontaining protein [Pseudonocardia lutea]|uniref:Sortase domain-bontaining protein n=1 Tax=Pseudonocardia lutea TaxID=2172015 RepID=A0ABW1II81_9PSEU
MTVPRRGGPALLALIGMVLVGSGLAMTTAMPRAASSDITPVASPAPASTPGPPQPTPVTPDHVASPPPGSVSATPAGPAKVAAPVTLSLPQAPDVPVVPVGVLPSGALQLPDQPSVLGWYAAGAAPGQDTGSAVVAGHIDSAALGPGPLKGLLDLPRGAPLQVVDAAGGIHRFSVVSRTSYRKSALPAELFRRDGPPQLALITCGGPFDTVRKQYADNVVVLAAPA